MTNPFWLQMTQNPFSSLLGDFNFFVAQKWHKKYHVIRVDVMLYNHVLHDIYLYMEVGWRVMMTNTYD